MPNKQGDGNVLLTDDIIVKEALRLLKNELVATKRVHRSYEAQYAKKGDTINIELPSRHKAASGRTLVKSPIVNRTTPLKVENQTHVGLEFNAVDRTLSLRQFSEKHLKSAIAQIAHAVDLKVLETAVLGSFYGSGTPGTAVDTDTFIDARAYMTKVGHPSDGMSSILLDPLDASSIRKDLKTLDNPDMVRTAIERAYCGQLAGSMSYETAQMPVHTVGDHGGTPLIAGGSQTGTSLDIDGGTNSTTGYLKKGDVFTIDGVYEVNPQTYKSTGRLQRFTVTADVDTSGTGTATVPISPELNDGTLTTTDGEGASVSLAAYQNVTNAPADDAPINIIGTANETYRQNLFMHKEGVTLAMVDIELPRTAPVAERVRDDDTGLSMCMTGQYSINEMDETYRIDVLYATKCIYPELVHRVWSATS